MRMQYDDNDELAIEHATLEDFEPECERECEEYTEEQEFEDIADLLDEDEDGRPQSAQRWRLDEPTSEEYLRARY